MRRLAVALAFGLAACAAFEPDVPPLVEIETTASPTQDGSSRGIHLVTVGTDGSVTRRFHGWNGTTPLRHVEPQTLSSQELGELRGLLSTPVTAEQGSAPVDALEFRITAHDAEKWSTECYELEVHHCPVPFVKLWQSLDELIGDLPEH
jgi:hypothetical protein